ncbi:MAG: flagellar biosynthesis protein FlhF, partial [Burkholderiaceae bacterium]
MNVQRFTAKTSREALSQVRQSLGDDAVVLSTRPCSEGVEVLAMAPEGMQQIERLAAPAAAPNEKVAPCAQAPVAKVAAAADASVEDDIAQLSMSTLSFQDYVRDRMLKRRQAAIEKSRAVKGEPAAPRAVAAQAAS